MVQVHDFPLPLVFGQGARGRPEVWRCMTRAGAGAFFGKASSEGGSGGEGEGTAKAKGTVVKLGGMSGLGLGGANKGAAAKTAPAGGIASRLARVAVAALKPAGGAGAASAGIGKLGGGSRLLAGALSNIGGQKVSARPNMVSKAMTAAKAAKTAPQDRGVASPATPGGLMSKKTAAAAAAAAGGGGAVASPSGGGGGGGGGGAESASPGKSTPKSPKRAASAGAASAGAAGGGSSTEKKAKTASKAASPGKGKAGGDLSKTDEEMLGEMINAVIEEGGEEGGDDGGGGSSKMSINKNFLKRLVSSTMFRRNAQADSEANEAFRMVDEYDEDEGEEEIETLPELIDVEAELADHASEIIHQAQRIRHRKGVALLRKVAAMYGVRIRIIG